MKRRDVHEAWETEGRLSGRKHHAALQSCSADLHPKAGWPNSCRSSQPQHAGDATAVASTPHVALHASGTSGLYVLIVRLVLHDDPVWVCPSKARCSTNTSSVCAGKGEEGHHRSLGPIIPVRLR